MIDGEVSIFIPLMRPKKLQALVENIADTTSQPYEVVVACSKQIAAQINSVIKCRLLLDNGGTYAERMNYMFDSTSSPFVFLAADDVLFHKNWLDHALRIMEYTNGVVVPQDLLNPVGTHCLVSRAYIQEFGSGTMDNSGSLLHSGYKHAYCDAELFDTARKRGRLAKSVNATVEHMHWAANKASFDDIYKLGDSFYLQDQEHYNTRRHLWA